MSIKHPVAFTIMLVVMLVSGSIPGTYMLSNVARADISAFAGGDGTKSNPYQIADADGLNEVRNHLAGGKYFIVTADIDLASYSGGTGWIPIGNAAESFTGHFNGNGHVIENLMINTGDDNAGLFGSTNAGSTISNIRLVNVNIQSDGEVVGSLVGLNGGSIHNSYAEGTVKGTNVVGGLVGLNGHLIYNSQANVEVTGNNIIGGLAGITTVEINKSYAMGNVNGDLIVGGLVGMLQGVTGKVTDSYAKGDLTGNNIVGGLAGSTVNNSTNVFFNNTYATGHVTGAGLPGGLTGFYNPTPVMSLAHNFFDEETTGQEYDSDYVATPLSTAQMKSETPFIQAGWDFDAIWAIDPSINEGYPHLRTYELTYASVDEDAGTTPMDTIKYAYGSTAILAGNTGDLTKSGFTFAGWNTLPDGSGDDYAAGDPFIMNGTTTLYAKWLSNNANLSDITIDTGVLTPAFSLPISTYTTEIPYDESSLHLTLIKADPLQEISVTSTDVDVQPAGADIYEITNVDAGTSTVLIQVKSPDETATMDYTLHITRKPALQSLVLSNGQLDVPFEPGITNYHAKVSHATSSLTVTASTYDTVATLTVNGLLVPSHDPSGAIALQVGDNPVLIEVTSLDGTQKTNYNLIVERARKPSSPCSNVAATNGQLSYSPGCEGELRLGEEISVLIPGGATNQTVEFQIEEVSDYEDLLLQQEILASAIYKLSNSKSIDLLKPVTVTFTFDPEQLTKGHAVGIFYYDEHNDTWTIVEGALMEEDQISVEAWHLAKFALLVVDEETGHPITVKETEDSAIDDDSAQSESDDADFSDIAGHWAEEYVKQAWHLGIVHGYPDGTFRPDQPITRAEFTVLLMLTLDSQGPELPLAFADSAEIGDWARAAISQALQEGIIHGHPDNTFRPNDILTRAEMAVMMAQAMNITANAISSTSFTDDQDIPHWAKASVEYLKQQGFIAGQDTNVFAPQAGATRAEVVRMMLQLLTP